MSDEGDGHRDRGFSSSPRRGRGDDRPGPGRPRLPHASFRDVARPAARRRGGAAAHDPRRALPLPRRSRARRSPRGGRGARRARRRRDQGDGLGRVRDAGTDQLGAQFTVAQLAASSTRRTPPASQSWRTPTHCSACRTPWRPASTGSSTSGASPEGARIDDELLDEAARRGVYVDLTMGNDRALHALMPAPPPAITNMGGSGVQLRGVLASRVESSPGSASTGSP